MEAKFSLVELGRTIQSQCEDLDLYVKRFQEKALDCCGPVGKETMIDVCLHVMANDLFGESFTLLIFQIDGGSQTNK